MALTRLKRWLIATHLLASTVLAFSLSSCGESSPALDGDLHGSSAAPTKDQPKLVKIQPLEDQTLEPCDLAIAAVVAAGIYGSAQIQGCAGGAPEEAAPNFNLLRLNAYCHEEICGSVLLGWYLVDTESGRVWEWDMAEDARGAEITPTM